MKHHARISSYALTMFAVCSAFFHNRGTHHSYRGSSHLRDINEWRDASFDSIQSTATENFSYISGDDGSKIGILDATALGKRPICVLPFPYDDLIVQGQTKQLRLYEDRFIELFEKCQNEHYGMLCMGLLTDSSGIVQTSALCEVEDFNRSDEFGIFVTIRVVGRVKLLELTQMEPFITGVCSEVIDEIPPSLDLPNMVADGIDSLLNEISVMELRLLQAKEYKEQQKAKEDALDAIPDDDIKARERIVKAALDGNLQVSEDGSPYSGFNDEDVSFQKSIFEEAYSDAFETDAQGFIVSDSSSTSGRSAKELTAISWAAFCVDDLKITDRIQALDCDNLFDRLKLAAHTLRGKKNMLAAKLALAGLGDPSELSEEDNDETSDT